MSPTIAPGSRHFDETFDGLDLAAADLRACQFEDCLFRTCVLQGAQLTDARLSGCTFEDCDASSVSLAGARVHEAVFRRSKLRGVDWTAPAALTLVRFEACVLDAGDFTAVDLTSAYLEKSSARETCFLDARLPGADLRGTDLTEARFGGADLREADLRGATGYAIHPEATRITGARVSLPEAASLLLALGLRVEP